jgi:RNA polymerase sigma factor (sigma-70 family)
MFSTPGLIGRAFAIGGMHVRGIPVVGKRVYGERAGVSPLTLNDLSPAAACDPPSAGGDARSPDRVDHRTSPDLPLDTLYREHGSRLQRLMARRVGRDEASDLVQEAFARLASIIAFARTPVTRPEAFVTTVATNILRDRARAAARRALHDHDLAHSSGTEAADPHRIAEGREALRAIERALARMSPRRRRIFLLHRHEFLTYAEIGRAVGMSEKGVKKQMAKALVELRAAVERPE